jgi:hypothetical protein
MSSKLLIEKKKIDDDLIKLKTKASDIINKQARKILKKKGLLKTDETSINEAKKQLETLKKNKENDIIQKALYKCNFKNKEKKIKKDINNVLIEYTNNKKKITPILNNYELLNNNIQKELISKTNKVINNYKTNDIKNKEKITLELKKINELKSNKINMLKTKSDDIKKRFDLINNKRDTDLNKINNEIKSLKNNCNDTLKIEIDKSKKEVDNRLTKGTNKKKRQVAFQKTKKKIYNVLQYII